MIVGRKWRALVGDTSLACVCGRRMNIHSVNAAKAVVQTVCRWGHMKLDGGHIDGRRLSTRYLEHYDLISNPGMRTSSRRLESQVSVPLESVNAATRRRRLITSIYPNPIAISDRISLLRQAEMLLQFMFEQ